MQAAVARGPHQDLEVMDVTLSDPGPSSAVVRMVASGLCHSDLNALDGRSTPPGWPLISGHEGYGVVEEIGSEVKGVSVGDHVLFSFAAACQQCYWCLRGQQNICTSLGAAAAPKGTLADGTPVFGHAGLGAFAEYGLLHHRSLVPVPATLPPERMALISCGVTTGFSAVDQCAKVEAASTVVVLGSGGVGMAIVQAARIVGAADIIVGDPTPGRRALAEQLGATATFDPLVEGAHEAVLELTGGRGADYVFESSGRQESAGFGFELVRRGGTLVLVGAIAPGLQPPWSLYDMMRGVKTVKGTLYGGAFPHRDFERLIRLADKGVLDLEAMVSDQIKLEQINDGIANLRDRGGLRSVIVF